MKSITILSGCSPVKDNESIRDLLPVLDKLPLPQKNQQLLEIIRNEKQTIKNKTLAIDYLSYPLGDNEEQELIQLLEKQDDQYLYPLLKLLAVAGTEKSYRFISAMKPSKSSAVEKQKRFAKLLLAAKLELKETTELLAVLLKDETPPVIESPLPLNFKPVSKRELKLMLEKIPATELRMPVSNDTAFSIKAGTQLYYFFLHEKLSDPEAWPRLSEKPQLAGILLSKDFDNIYIKHHHYIFASPSGKGFQISIFRRDGTLFMVAKMSYDEKENSLQVSNNAERETTGKKNTLQINLSFVRMQPKRKTLPAPEPAISEL